MVWTCGRMDEYHKWRQGTNTEISLVGWREGGLRQQRDDAGGARQSAKDRKEWRDLFHTLMSFTRPFLFGS